jgi:hypothetical protein
MSTLHRTLMENILHGYDVLPSAVHLTASTLAMLAPEVAFVRMGLYVMPLGIDHGIAKLGSLDFLEGNSVKTQMALDYSHTESVRTGAGFSRATAAKMPQLDLCVMNPPFVRSVGGNLLFGSLPDERGRLQTELKRRVKQIGASATAGLGSVFVALADRWLKKNGRLAFVLPAALASGEAWGDTRQLISKKYHLETVVSSQDAERQNFSENTDLSEVLFIARKLEDGETAGRTRYVNLWRNPRSIHEALDLANRINSAPEPVAVEADGVTPIMGPNGKLGEIVTLPPATGETNWYGALFAQTELIRTFKRINDENLIRVAANGGSATVPLCPLQELGDLGPDRARIHDGFTITENDLTPYPAFWGHKSEFVRTIAQEPNSHLTVRLDSPRGPAYGPHLWERAGRILLVERLWPITQRVLAVGFNTPILGNTWWSLQSKILTEDQEKALLLWCNCSIALLLYFGRRVVTRSAWMQMKQPGWQAMPVLDVRQLSAKQLALFVKAYDRISRMPLEPLAQVKTDEARCEIDVAVCKILKLPDLAFLRDQLSLEPGLTGVEVATRKTAVKALPDSDGGDDESLEL